MLRRTGIFCLSSESLFSVICVSRVTVHWSRATIPESRTPLQALLWRFSGLHLAAGKFPLVLQPVTGFAPGKKNLPLLFHHRAGNCLHDKPSMLLSCSEKCSKTKAKVRMYIYTQFLVSQGVGNSMVYTTADTIVTDR